MPTLGLTGINMGPCASADAAVRIGTLAEQLGYDSLWTGEHVVVPRPRVAPSLIEPDYPILDPLLTLAALAAATSRVRLATGIVILPQRHPVILAKELASLDVLSRGRLIFGLGVGYLEAEMRALGIPMAGRGTRATEYLQVMRTLWTADRPAFHGQHITFDSVDAHPRPVQNPLPVVVAGHSPAAHRRAVRHGDGWYGFNLDRRTTRDQLGALRREATTAGRTFDQLTITVSPTEPLTVTVVQDYADLGVHRLVLVPPPPFWRTDAASFELTDFVHANAPERVGAEPR